ncbi:hypothetical protein C2S51_035219 [Perilla frutescens var. frutescens]|nr:hypothetical protein C2S51_035219 [Perilla frutescens var. frutescens]
MYSMRLVQVETLNNPVNYLHNLERKARRRISSIAAKVGGARLRAFCSSELYVNRGDDEVRRSSHYEPSVWDFNYIQSLNNQYKDKRHLIKRGELIEQVKILMEEEMEALQQFELIDDLNNLGLSCFFHNNINQKLSSIYHHNKCFHNNINEEEYEIRDLYFTSLGFRLLRQHGFQVSQEVFDCFKNEEGCDFKASLGEHTKGLLQLYEASFLLRQGEDTLEVARQFATKFLHKKLDENEIDEDDDHQLLSSIRHSLEIPLHWRIQRVEARWFLDAYVSRPDMNPIIFELAKLDFNIIQAAQQEELKDISRWWNGTCLAEKVPFVRDRLVESYFWAIGLFEAHQYGYLRKIAAKIMTLITSLDDVYDIYGTLDELQLLTDTFRRWDIESIKGLPYSMQLFYLAIHNFVSELAYDTLKEHGFLSIQYLKRSWVDLVEGYLEEAKWYYNEYTPRLEEYLKNGSVTIGAPAVISQLYFTVASSIEKSDIVDSFYKYRHIICLSGRLVRLPDDLGTSPFEIKRGDVAKAMQCYMKERNATEKEAEEHVRFLIREAWKEMNTAATCPFMEDFVAAAAANLARAAQFMYLDGDGNHLELQRRIQSLLFEPYG